MLPFCAVANCRSNTKKIKNINFRAFSFPSNKDQQRQWLLFCHREDVDTKNERICQKHFKKEDFERDLVFEFGMSKKPKPAILKPDAVPSVFSGHYTQDSDNDCRSSSCANKDVHKQEKQAIAERKKIVADLLAEYEKKQNADTVCISYEDCEIDNEPGNGEDAERRAIEERKKIVDDLLAEYEKNQATLDVYESDDDEPNKYKRTADDEDCLQVVVDADAYLRVLEEENAELKKTNFKLKLNETANARTLRLLQKRLQKAEGLYNQLTSHLSQIFSKAQIDKMLKSGRRIVWPEEDLVDACTLYAVSGRAYDILLNKNYPLPSIRTLQHWDANQRKLLVEQEDPNSDCTIHHWRCKHRTEKAERRKVLRQQARQKRRAELKDSQMELKLKELEDTVVIPNTDHNYVHS